METLAPIQTRLKLLFGKDEKDVSKDVCADLLSFSYDDKETAEADEVRLTLKDPDGKWADTWKPDGGEVIRASITAGTVLNGMQTLPCGKFFVDSFRTSGSPRVMEIKAVSIPLNKPIRKRLKTRAWEKTTLKQIAETIAKEAEATLLWDSEDNPTFDRQDQKKESDLKFLSRLCEENGLSIKLTDDQIVIFSQESYEKKAAVATYILGTSDIMRWDFEQEQSETYKSVTVSYRDPRLKKRGSAGSHRTKESTGKTVAKQANPAVNSYTYTDPAADENGQEYQLKKRASSIDDAKRLAKAKLRQLNMRRVKGSMTVIGNPSLVAGVVISCQGFGSFDGSFICENVTHAVSGSGYTTQLRLRRVNNEY
jgi:phage protein D